MLPIERALKRLEKSKKYKSKNINYDKEYLAMLIKRANFLFTPHTYSTRGVGFSEDETKDMDNERRTVDFLIECLREKIWGSNKEISEVENER